MICKKCGKEYDPWYSGKPIENNLCRLCNYREWKKFDTEHEDDYRRIQDIQGKGHPHHCACRQVWGDGECECDLYAKGYNPYRWMGK